ncbi:MAG: iron-sulfur cluster assembly scaffold protein [Alphaproteobacteria bacterium]
MTDDPLYRREILRLAADATGAGHLPAPTALGSANNPACGDWVKVELALDGDRITAFAHTEQACVLTQASAALLASLAAGQDREGMAALAEAVRGFLKGGTAPGGYGVFDGVIGHAGRHRCVLLPLEAALKALEQSEEAPMAAEGQHRA